MNKWPTEILTPRPLTNEELLLLADFMIFIGFDDHVIASIVPAEGMQSNPEAIHVPGNNTIN